MERGLVRAATLVRIWDWFPVKMIRATAAHSCVSPRLVIHTCDDCWLGAHNTSWGHSDPTPIYACTARSGCIAVERTAGSALASQLRENPPWSCTDCGSPARFTSPC